MHVDVHVSILIPCGKNGGLEEKKTAREIGTKALSGYHT